MTNTKRHTKELEALWWDWLSTSERLLRSLHEQTAALTLRDAARVERIQPELDTMMSHMEDLDAKALACANELAGELGCQPNLRGLVQALERNEGMSLQSVANRVIVVARNVQTVVAKNRALIEAELEYVNGTMALVAKEAAGNEGPYATEPVTNVVMNQAA